MFHWWYYGKTVAVFLFVAKLRRIPEVEYPLHVSLHWEPDKVDRTRFVLQENENGEIDVRIVYFLQELDQLSYL